MKATFLYFLLDYDDGEDEGHIYIELDGIDIIRRIVVIDGVGHWSNRTDFRTLFYAIYDDEIVSKTELVNDCDAREITASDFEIVWMFHRSQND